MSCIGCIQAAIEKESKLEAIRKEARQLAIKTNEHVFIFQIPDGDISFTTATAAYQNGITGNPIDIISPA